MLPNDQLRLRGSYSSSFEPSSPVQSSPPFMAHLLPWQQMMPNSSYNLSPGGHPQNQHFYQHNLGTRGASAPPPTHLNNSSPSVLETKYFVTRSGPLGTRTQANAAASFFAKAHQRLQYQQMMTTSSSASSSPQVGRVRRGRTRDGSLEDSSEERDQFPTNFRTLVHRSPPPIPSSVLRKLESTEVPSGLGKIRIIVRVSEATNCFDPHQQQEHRRHFQVDKKKRQVTLYDPSVFRGVNGLDSEHLNVALEERKLGVAAPKMFAFDGLFSSEDSHEEVCAAALPDVVQAVMNGSDGCLFCFGHANLGKTRSMLGSDECSKDMGAIPIAIAWLYRAIKEKKTNAAAKFSVRVSALEITSQREEVRDLLAPYETPDSDQSPGAFLRSLPVTSAGSLLQNQSELRASTAEKAAYYLDAALAGRSLDAQGRESHLIFTVHIYQCSVSQSGKGGVVLGGRSRLHLIDFGGCERTRLPGGGITLSGLGNVILGIFNGQKHLPHRDSKVTQVLKECLGSLTCQATMLAHVSPEASHYSETLHTVQLASRLHRMRRKRLKAANGGSGSTSSDEHRRLTKLRSRSSGSSGRSTTSGTSTNISSSEMSCDTVVYRGHSDGSGTDSEHPPFLLPHLRLSSGSSGGSSAPGSLRGSLDEIPRPRRRTSGSRILTNGAISSPRRNNSPHLMRSPHRSLSSLPVIHEVNTNSRKMPLNGLVPVQGRQRMRDLSAPPPPTSEKQEQWVDASPSCHVKASPGQSNIQSPSQQQSGVFASRKEVWIDGAPEQSNNIKRYGYMDEHKASMISTWVETQSEQKVQQEPEFRALTQFKTCDSDEGPANNVAAGKDSHHEVMVHSSQRGGGKLDADAEVKKCPPPPPPRRTPPRESKGQSSLVALVDECNRLAKTFGDKAIDREVIDNFETIEVTETASRKAVPISDSAWQVTEAEISRRMRVRQHDHARSRSEEPEEHPLRILSEENLTVVSSFAASLGDLNTVDDDDEIDPSKLSFFEVPDFNSIKDDMEKQDNFISERFKEFAQLERSINNDKSEMNDNFSDSRFSASNNNKEVLLTFGRSNNNNNVGHKSDSHADQEELDKVKCHYQEMQKPKSIGDKLTPQKQFLLLAQSLRHPDGSSNPELSILEQRSPGNGRSSSDLEDDVGNQKQPQDNANGNLLSRLPGAKTPCIDNSQQKSSAKNNLPVSKTSNSQSSAVKKESSRFGFKFLRIFGSTRKLNKSKTNIEEEGSNIRRSKSCDRKTVSVVNSNKAHHHLSRDGLIRGSLRAASSSPSIKTSAGDSSNKAKEKPSNKNEGRMIDLSATGTPSTLSIATEWEYQENEEDNRNGNGCFKQGGGGGSANAPKQHQQGSKTDRKSSGYDSLGGESSSLDSNQENDDPALRAKLLRCESLNSKMGQEVPYSTPTDNNIQIMQYDELDIMRMEQRLRYAPYK